MKSILNEMLIAFELYNRGYISEDKWKQYKEEAAMALITDHEMKRPWWKIW